MSWTTKRDGTLHFALGIDHYAQIEKNGFGQRWQAYVGRLKRSDETRNPTRFEKWGVASEFEDLFHAKLWCQERLDHAQANVAEG